MFLSADYSAIELRTLAVICESQFGRSRLGEIIRDGIDAHSYTASVFADMTLDQFQQLPAKERKELRQRAKAIGFGVPGGLGPASLVQYAQQTYGVILTLEDADQFRTRLITEVYPELEQYLASDSADHLANALRCDPKDVQRYFNDQSLAGARKVVAGKPCKRTGVPYRKYFIDQTWKKLQTLNRNHSLIEPLGQRAASPDLAKKLFDGPVTTLTGRRRAAVGFTQAHNTPFQGLAADGAKEALWRLYRIGYRIVAFVHDEVVIELPEGSDWGQQANDVCRIMKEAMCCAMDSDIPIDVEFSVSRRWYKEAEEVRDANGQLLLWTPDTCPALSIPVE